MYCSFFFFHGETVSEKSETPPFNLSSHTLAGGSGEEKNRVGRIDGKGKGTHCACLKLLYSVILLKKLFPQ